MDDDAKRLGWIETLLAGRAHPEVVNEAVLQLEASLMSEGSGYFAKGEYDLALAKYFWALRLPEPASHKEDLMRLSLDAWRHLSEQQEEIEHLQVLNLPVFQDLKVELKYRWSRIRKKELYSRFKRLDAERSLLAKKFADLELIRGQLMAPEDGMLIAEDGMLIAELRLDRERRARKLLEEIHEELTNAAKEPDPSARADLFAQVKKKEQEALDHLDGSASNYADQIVEYVAAAEELLLKSSVDRLASDINRESMRLREERYREFVQGITVGEVLTEQESVERGLAAICRAFRLFKGDDRLSEVKRLSLQWVDQYAKFQVRKLATESPEETRGTVAKAIGILDNCSHELPLELTQGFGAFLDEIRKMLDPVPVPKPEIVSSDSGSGAFRWFVKWVKRVRAGG